MFSIENPLAIQLDQPNYPVLHKHAVLGIRDCEYSSGSRPPAIGAQVNDAGADGQAVPFNGVARYSRPLGFFN